MKDQIHSHDEILLRLAAFELVTLGEANLACSAAHTLLEMV
jgi:hypothetical protein